jgi:radical SAM superfamily enzyme YgiQ (UPF0313 family)
VLINPKFEASFWGFEHAMPFFGKRASMPIAALPLLAALTPHEHDVVIVDENVEPIDFEMCVKADIVGITGMVVQRKRMREILSELKQRGAFTVVGGPWITAKEDYFAGLADVIFVGEADESWPRFLSDWGRGRVVTRYEQAEKTDMSMLPNPRLDLLKMNQYAFGNVQFSRGCPFLCEFCDIIVMFGRRPRIKTASQIISELENLLAHKQSTVFIVDDNLIGDKKAIKQILMEVIEWQNSKGYPITFFTEASLDLADDAELMRLMVAANINGVFVGIESPNTESLREARKLQNVRAGGTMIEKVRRIQSAGMEVCAGMILGFDNDDQTVFDAHRDFLTDARINMAMVGMLSAIPNTPLYKRLADSGRLDHADPPRYGTNIVPLKMSGQELRDGYVRLMAELYDPAAFFGRVDDLYLRGKLDYDKAWRNYTSRHPFKRAAREAYRWIEALVLTVRLMTRVQDYKLRDRYRSQLLNCARLRWDAASVRIYAEKCAMHYHMHHLVTAMQKMDTYQINTF